MYTNYDSNFSKKPEGAGRRRPLHRLMAGLLLGASLVALIPFPEPSPAPEAEPPNGAIYRPDGGQRLSADGPLPPNALSGLNLGRRLDLAATPVRLLAALPSLGERSAAKVKATGELTARQREALRDFIHAEIDEK